MFAALELIPDETTPHFIRLPDRLQITFCICHCDTFMQNAMEKHERRNSLVHRTMNKHTPALERVHHPAKSAKIRCRGSFKVHCSVHIRHAETSHDTPLLREVVVGGRKGQINDHLKPLLTDRAKLRLRGLAGSAKPLANRAEAIDLRQGCWRSLHLYRVASRSGLILVERIVRVSL